MKKMTRLLTVAATVAVLAWPVAASGATLVQDQCTEANKTAWYATFREHFKSDQQPKAYEAAKKYLTACTEDTQITQYLKKWVTAYEKEIRKVKLAQLLFTDKNYDEAFKLGREILTDEPDNVKVLMQLGYGGYLASTNKNTSFNADALNYARKAIQMIESGKAPDDWQPFPNKDEALAFLNYYIGVTTLAQDAGAALSSLLKAARFESSLKKSPFTYDRIATAYETGLYAKLSAEYKTKYGGQNETPESKLALENINQVVDRMIDAYARAVATAGADPKYTAQKAEWNEALKTWYKFRNKDSETGMNELVAGILAKPLPPEPTPLTSLPVSAPAPAATPASGTGTPASGNGTTGTASGAPAGSTANSTTANTQTATKPATPPANSPTKPAGTRKPRRNHRGN